MKDIFKDDVSLSRIKAVLTSLAKAGEINLCVLDVLGNPIIYPTNDCACPFGLVDFVTPIFYDGEFLGAVCGGQVRSTEAAARADFVYPFFGRNEYGVDEKRMRELFEAMPDRPAERFFESAKLVELFAGNLGSVTAVVEMSRREEAENLAERERLRPAFSHIEKNFTKDIARELFFPPVRQGDGDDVPALHQRTQDRPCQRAVAIRHAQSQHRRI